MPNAHGSHEMATRHRYVNRTKEHRRGRAALWASVIVACQCLSQRPAHAAAPGPSDDDGSAWTDPDPAPAHPADPTMGRGLLALGGELAYTLRDGWEDKTAIGFDIELLGARADWPILIGLGLGAFSFGQSRTDGPTVLFADDFGLHLEDTRVVRSTAVLHAEIVARLQPFFWRVSPYFETYLGIASLGTEARLETSGGETLASDDKLRSTGFLSGLGAGLDLVLVRHPPENAMGADLVLSAGIQRLFVSSVAEPTYFGSGSAVTAGESRAPMSAWVPFLALALSFGATQDARAPAAPP